MSAYQASLPVGERRVPVNRCRPVREMDAGQRSMPTLQRRPAMMR